MKKNSLVKLVISLLTLNYSLFGCCCDTQFFQNLKLQTTNNFDQ